MKTLFIFILALSLFCCTGKNSQKDSDSTKKTEIESVVDEDSELLKELETEVDKIEKKSEEINIKLDSVLNEL